jgi:hypothetical protein
METKFEHNIIFRDIFTWNSSKSGFDVVWRYLTRCCFRSMFVNISDDSQTFIAFSTSIRPKEGFLTTWNWTLWSTPITLEVKLRLKGVITAAVWCRTVNPVLFSSRQYCGETETRIFEMGLVSIPSETCKEMDESLIGELLWWTNKIFFSSRSLCVKDEIWTPSLFFCSKCPTSDSTIL